MKHVFIVGCPRSGSTWTTHLLAHHPRVATFQHAKIFDYLLRMEQWHRFKTQYSFLIEPKVDGELDKEKKNRRLDSLLPIEDLYPMLGTLAAGILDSVAGLREEVDVVVDKTPENGHHAEFILKVLPDAHFFHIVRDPRACFCSHRNASSSWARWEFPTQPIDGARFWRDDVVAARKIQDLTDNYLEVRYEDLKSDGPAQLAKTFAWLGLEASPDFLEKTIAGSTKEKTRNIKELPSNFVRETPKGGWRDELSPRHARIIEHIAGALMDDLGYERSQPPFGGPPLSIRLHDLGARALDVIEKKATRLTQLAHWRWVGRKLEWPNP